MTDSGDIIIFAVVFIILFFIGGIIGELSLPPFPGKFFISGFLIAVFGTGAGFLFIQANSVAIKER